MKRVIRTAIFFTLVVTAVSGQTQEMPRRTCRECKITKEYDRFKDHTSFNLTPMAVAEVSDGTMFIWVAGGYKGQTASAKNKVCVIAITFVTRRVFSASNTELAALVDGKPETFGALTLSSRSALSYAQTVTYSRLAKVSLVRKIGSAAKVEMRFGGIEFQLSKDQRYAMLDLLSDLEGASN
ncbi:MAG TPA: hypothetical protein VK388_00500 [Pyrinomonadaceae bacterium]|nr:hypothetical protein [Pyrinomonadaceae bacterium]